MADGDGLKFFIKNSGYAKKDPNGYRTTLDPDEKAKFLNWVHSNKVPYDPSPTADYDMPGFWKALVNKDPRAATAVNPNDQQMHYPDYWKTPFHQSFSSESQWALPNAPSWNELDQLVLPDGTIVYDERGAE